MLTRLLYVSDVNKDQPLDMESLVEAAVRKNKANDITGVLWLTGKNFVQVLEGGRLSVSNTYNIIANDPRHSNVEIVSCNIFLNACSINGIWLLSGIARKIDNMSCDIVPQTNYIPNVCQLKAYWVS